MWFGMVGRMGPGMRQGVEFGMDRREWVILGVNVGHTIVMNGEFVA